MVLAYDAVDDSAYGVRGSAESEHCGGGDVRGGIQRRAGWCIQEFDLRSSEADLFSWGDSVMRYGR